MNKHLFTFSTERSPIINSEKLQQYFSNSLSRCKDELIICSGFITKVGLNWVLDRCQEFEDVDVNLTTASLQKLLGDVKSDLEHELSVQRREKGRRADGREEALIFVTDYLTSLMTAAEIESAKSPV